jgi:predicted dehydrogenase
MSGGRARLRVGIAGAGLRGRLYARALRRVDAVEVVGLCDADPAAAAVANAALELPVHTMLEALLERPPDALIIATPDFAHAEPAVAAAQAGCHLMVEKPLATTVEDARRIADAVRSAGVQCMVAFENRWNPAFSTLRARVASGELGRIVSQTAILNVTRSVPTGMIGWAARTSPLWFQMSHTIDLASWLAASRPVRLSAVGSCGHLASLGLDGLDSVQALVEFADGSTACLESGWLLPDSMPSFADFRYQVIGERGHASIDQLDQTLRVASDRLTFPRTLALEVEGEPQGFPTWMVTQFVNDLLAGRMVGPTIDDGVAVTRALAAIERSIERREPVAIHDDAGQPSSQSDAIGPGAIAGPSSRSAQP